MYERIELNKDEKKKKRKFLQKIERLYIMPNNSGRVGDLRRGNIEINFPSVRSTTEIELKIRE
jgi:hypothetical protein